MLTASRPTYNTHKGEVDCISSVKEDKAMHLSSKNEFVVG